MSAATAADWERLCEWSHRVAAFPLGAEHLEVMRTYLETLLFWNRKLALVSQRDPAQILDKHFADSLFAAAQCSDRDAIVDLGSGAGFPGLVIALARPLARVTLIESRGKKASFLETVARATAARNVTVCNARIDDVGRDIRHHGRYSVAIARALTTTADFLRMAAPFLASGGRALALRSVGEGNDGPPFKLELDYTLPDGTPRRLLVYA